ncbi:MAG: hypothetical protein EXS42_05625 [Lacunisphaera sp.]|nr:hypothetical protein [Lacunisphaera sp.]
MTRSSSDRIDALGRSNSSVAFGDSKQLVARLHLNEPGPGKTEIELTLIQSIQSSSVGGTSQQKLQDHSFLML